MDLLKSIINQQKEAVSAEKKNSGQRWICRGKTIEQQREEARRKALEEEKKRKREEIERLNEYAKHLGERKRKKTEEGAVEHPGASSATEGVAQLTNEEEEEEEAQPPIPKHEVVKKLRRLKAPITLFAETDWQRYTRLCQLELLHHEDELMAGQRNAFLNPQDEEDDDDEEEEDTFDKDLGEPSRSRSSSGHEASSRAGETRKNAEKTQERKSRKEGVTQEDGASASTLEGGGREASGVTPAVVDESPKKDRGEGQEPRKDSTEERRESGGEGPKNEGREKEGVEKKVSKETTVVRWVRRMLHEWEAELKARPDSEKHTAEGKFATTLQRQTRKDLKPLLRKLRAKELEADILEKLYTVVQCCDERRYRSAHDTYMLLAIGNAAWPVGVTMVGIHERAGRAKLFTSQVAHILNDETTRKYIQMIKRLMSFCQRRYPADPSQTISLSTIHI